MALRTIETIKAGDSLCKVRRDTDCNEYRVELWIDGVHQAASDYHCDDKQDAISTARKMLEG